jgi:predicted transcriptional regulator
MREITASDLMNPEVLTVPDTLTVRELARFLVDNDITGAPVIDREGRMIGVVSVVDVAEAVAGGESAFGVDRADDVRVADLLHPGVYTVAEEAGVAEIAKLLLEKHIHRLVVIRDERPVGVVSTSDLLGLLFED